MEILPYILIILGSNNGSVNGIEFMNQAACLNAQTQVQEYRGGTNLRYGAICVPKIIRK